MLEALASTKLNLLLNVGFNKEVAKEGAMYWDKDCFALKKLIEKSDALTGELIRQYDVASMDRVLQQFNWVDIIGKYENVFLK